jgi:subtilisin-like proprotein convertase family protein
LIASIYGNALGGMGVAPSASLNGYNFIASSQLTSDYLASLGGSASNPTSNNVWVFNQSFGTSNAVDVPVNPSVAAQYASGAATLRGGRGAIYVKSAGNGFKSFGTAADCSGATSIGVSCQNASMDPGNTLPYNIVVGALEASGVKSSYSTAGSAVWVSAPGGEFGLNASVVGGGFIPEAYRAAMVTTDQSGCTNGYSRTGATTSSFNQGIFPNTLCNYTNTMNGTSSAAPVTSGVVALVLEANPTLTWRDVKHVLASTSTKVDAAIPAVLDASVTGGPYVAELPWTTNAAGYVFHNWYGFGRVNVDAAVEMAKTYRYGQLGTLTTTSWASSGTLSLAIPDNAAAGVTSSIAMPTALTIEAIQIAVTATHQWTGDLGIELVSPSGTKSILLNIKNGFTDTTGLAGMVLESNAFYGEPSAGTWTIRVLDGRASRTGTFTNWQIRVFGH